MGLGFPGEQVTISGSGQPPPHSGQSQGDRWHPSLLRTPTPVCRICRLCLLPTCHSGRFLGPPSLWLASSFPLFHLNHLLFPSTSPHPPLTESHLPSQGGPSTLFQSLSTVPLTPCLGFQGSSGKTWLLVPTQPLRVCGLGHCLTHPLEACPRHPPQLGFTKQFLTQLWKARHLQAQIRGGSISFPVGQPHKTHPGQTVLNPRRVGWGHWYKQFTK